MVRWGHRGWKEEVQVSSRQSRWWKGRCYCHRSSRGCRALWPPCCWSLCHWERVVPAEGEVKWRQDSGRPCPSRGSQASSSPSLLRLVSAGGRQWWVGTAAVKFCRVLCKNVRSRGRINRVLWICWQWPMSPNLQQEVIEGHGAGSRRGTGAEASPSHNLFPVFRCRGRRQTALCLLSSSVPGSAVALSHLN